MARRLVVVSIAAAAVVTAAVGAVVIWRVPIAQSMLDRAAEDLEVPGARARVAGIAADQLRLTDLAAGDQGEVTADSVEVDFRVREIVRGRLDKVAIGGLTLNLDLRDEAKALGSLQPLVDRALESGPSDTDAKPFAARLPDVELREGSVRAETPYGPASFAFDGTLAAGREANPTLNLQGHLDSAWASLSADLSADGDPQTQAKARLAISDGRIGLPDGRLQVDKLAGEMYVSVEDGRPHTGHGELAAGGLAVAGTSFDRAEATFDLSRQRADLSARLGSDDGSFDLSLDGRVEALDAAPHLTLALRSEIGEAAPIWAFSRPPFPTGGSGHIELEADGDAPALPQLPADPAALQAWLAAGAVSGRATGTFSGLSLPDSAATATALLDIDAAWADGALRLATRQENRVAATGITAKDFAGFDLPAGLADELIRLTGGSLSVSLPAPSQPPAALVWRQGDPKPKARFEGSAGITAGPFAATLTGEAEAALAPAPALVHADLSEAALSASGVAIAGYAIDDLQVTGRFAGDPRSFEADGQLIGRFAVPDLNGLSADRLSLSLPFRVSRAAQTFDLALPQPGRLTVNGLKAAQLTAEGPVDIALAGGDARLTLDDVDAAFALAHTTRLGIDSTRLLLRTEGGTRIPFQITLPRVEVAGELSADGRYRGQAAVREAKLALPESDLAFDGLSADLTLPGDPAHATATFEIAAARHLASPAAFAPLPVSGRASRHGETVELTARVDRPDGEPMVDVAASHDLASGSGHADITLSPLRFEPGGLQPAALSPLLAELSDARGTAEGSATVAWDRNGLAGSAQFAIHDLSFSGHGATVSGLDLDLALNSLQPPASPPHQRLSADLVDVGVPLKNLEAQFRLLPDSPGRILVEEASFATVGSRVTLRDTVIDPMSERLDTQLLVDQVDVGVLFEVLAVDGLSGSGELAGTIPVKRDGDRVIIEDARLTAGGPGVLRFRSDAAARALASGGEHVDLVIKALQDFHYQTLTLTGNLDRDGEASLRLEILGNNPNVLDGYAFQLNINLTGHPAPILEALHLGRTLFEQILGRARRLSR
jgi:Dicarboxylate transport